MLAVAYGHIDAVSLLLEKEADVDAVDVMGCTALHRGVRGLPQLSSSSSFVVGVLLFSSLQEFLVKRLFPKTTN